MPPQHTTEVDSSSSKSGTELDKSLSDYQIQVDDWIYSAETLAKSHPGGELFVRAFGGRDATEAFLSYHRRTFPHDKMRYVKKISLFYYNTYTHITISLHNFQKII